MTTEILIKLNEQNGFDYELLLDEHQKKQLLADIDTFIGEKLTQLIPDRYDYEYTLLPDDDVWKKFGVSQIINRAWRPK